MNFGWANGLSVLESSPSLTLLFLLTSSRSDGHIMAIVCRMVSISTGADRRFGYRVFSSWGRSLLPSLFVMQYFRQQSIRIASWWSAGTAVFAVGVDVTEHSGTSILAIIPRRCGYSLQKVVSILNSTITHIGNKKVKDPRQLIWGYITRGCSTASNCNGSVSSIRWITAKLLIRSKSRHIYFESTL